MIRTCNTAHLISESYVECDYIKPTGEEVLNEKGGKDDVGRVIQVGDKDVQVDSVGDFHLWDNPESDEGFWFNACAENDCYNLRACGEPILKRTICADDWGYGGSLRRVNVHQHNFLGDGHMVGSGIHTM